MELKTTQAIQLRALITECLPYEMPLEINPKWLYNWFEETADWISKEKLGLRPTSELDLLTIALLSHDKRNDLPSHASRSSSPRIAMYSPLDNTSWRAPASFVVRRDSFRVRELDHLSIASQLSLAFLYFNKKDSILHYSNVDNSSLRHPVRTNELGKYLGRKRVRAGKPDEVSVQTAQRHIGTFNSFFTYDQHAFVGQFYDSSRWQALEAKWRHLRRLDVSNCFRSIYTHSFAWSTGTDIFSKLHLNQPKTQLANLDLGRLFDKVMQSCNWGETHGICIGPEASRIFAEIIFQSIDRKIKNRLFSRDVKPRSYEILRYVDDYFLFANDESVLTKLSATVNDVLSEHRFAVNDSKTFDMVTPFTTPVSEKKTRLKSYLKSALPFENELPYSERRDIAIELKTLLIGNANDSAAIGASLSHVERRLRKFIEKRSRKVSSMDSALELLQYSWEFCHSMIYQYLSHPSIASSMKVVRLLRLFSAFPSLCTMLNDRDRELVEFRSNEYIRFAIHKIVRRLLDVEYSEIEICHFLSVADACDIRLPSGSEMAQSLLDKVRAGFNENQNARSNHAYILLLLSVVKYFLKDSERAPGSRDAALALCKDVSLRILSKGYVPESIIASHASQETFILAISTCPLLSDSEKFMLVDQPWLRSLLSNRFAEISNDRSAAKFIRRVLASASSKSSVEGFYQWFPDDFDSQLYEKEPQFVY